MTKDTKDSKDSKVTKDHDDMSLHLTRTTHDDANAGELPAQTGEGGSAHACLALC